MAMLCLGVLTFSYAGYIIIPMLMEEVNTPAVPNEPFKILDKKIEPHWVLWPVYSFDTYWFQYNNTKYSWVEIDESDYNAYDIGDMFRQIHWILH